MKFNGSYVALVTPFDKNNEIDEDKLRELVEFHVSEGTTGIVPCGTTGEYPTLTHEEHERVTKIVVEQVNKRIQVIAGAGSNNTNRAIELTKYAKDIGADAALSTCPYYNKPSQRGLYAHYKAITDAVDFPIMLYNVPGRTGVNINPETVQQLSEINNIVAIKEASGSIEQMIRIKELCSDKIEILSGEDHLILPMLSIGAKGIVSVVANILPNDMANLVRAYEEKNYNKAFEIHSKLYEISTNMFIEGNPTTVKAAMKILNILDNENVRLPLIRSEESTKNKLIKLFKEKNIV